MKFNEKLTKLRKMEGLSQEELGYKLNVTRQTVSKWELGQTTPEMDKVIELSKIFNISVDDLLNDSEVQSAKTIINEIQKEGKVQEAVNQETINEKNIKENITNKEDINANSYVSPKDDRHKRDMWIMLILGCLFVVTLALLIVKGYELISEKVEWLNPQNVINQKEELQIENKDNIDNNKTQESSLVNSIEDVEKTNIISQKEETNIVKENVNKTQTTVTNTDKRPGQTNSSTTTSSTEISSSTHQNKPTAQTITPSTQVPSTTPTQPSNNFAGDFEIKKFNSLIEMYAGTQKGFHVKSLLDHMITRNKTESRKVTIQFQGIETQDETTIRNLKGNFSDFEDCEVILEYDAQGFVRKIIIQK